VSLLRPFGEILSASLFWGDVDHRRALADPVVLDHLTTARVKDRMQSEPEQQNRGAMLLSYRVEDDYGATEAHATFARKDEPTAKGDGPHPLYGPPD